MIVVMGRINDAMWDVCYIVHFRCSSMNPNIRHAVRKSVSGIKDIMKPHS